MAANQENVVLPIGVYIANVDNFFGLWLITNHGPPLPLAVSIVSNLFSPNAFLRQEPDNCPKAVERIYRCFVVILFHFSLFAIIVGDHVQDKVQYI